MGSRYDLTREGLATVLDDEPRYRADQVWEALYQRGAEPAEMTNLPQALRRHLAEHPDFRPALELAHQSISDGGETAKWLWRLADGREVETVLMHYPGRSTVCVSSQAGCAMACSFCATGQAGFDRNLSTGEIVEQAVHARRAAAEAGRRLSNVVFMGMGEPLANYDRTWEAVERIHGDLGLSARHITVSTVGVVPGIRRLAQEALPVTLAVSLHAANDDLREQLVPLNRRYPLAEVEAACAEYLAAGGRRMSIEWALIDGVNDRYSDAAELAAIARRLGAHVNLIPLNRTPGFPTLGTAAEDVRTFRGWLTALDVNATVRRNRGNDIDAACGQLRATVGSGRRTIPVRALSD